MRETACAIKNLAQKLSREAICNFRKVKWWNILIAAWVYYQEVEYVDYINAIIIHYVRTCHASPIAHPWDYQSNINDPDAPL